jgi:hypothetical protein
MPDKPPPDDMKDIWRNQTTDPPQISLEHFRKKAQRLQKKAKREVYTGYVVALVLIVVFSVPFAESQQTVQRVGLGLLMLWAILIPFLAQRRLWSEPMSPDTALAPGIAFYRRQLERHHGYQRRIWLWLAPMFLGAGLYLSPAIAGIARDPAHAPKALPFGILLMIWVVLFLNIRRRKLRKLRRKLGKLAELEKEISS